jgi:hypothetical protein
MFTEIFIEFLEKNGIITSEFGYERILKNYPQIKSEIRRQLKYKESPAALMIKFSPDIIAYFKKNQKFFFVDIKTSITPIFLQAQVDRIRQHSKIPSLVREDIGEIEREAWLVYNMFYPRDRVAIVMACPYHPKLIVAEWVSRIKCLWCLKQHKEPWDCEECPIFKSGGIFGVVQNEFAGGSGTPHTNIHLGQMPELKDFLKREFNVQVSEESYTELIDEVKAWPLVKPSGDINWLQFLYASLELRQKCPWLKCQLRRDTYSELKQKYPWLKDLLPQDFIQEIF